MGPVAVLNQVGVPNNGYSVFQDVALRHITLRGMCRESGLIRQGKVIGQVKQPLSSPALHYSDFVKFLAGGLHLTTDHIIARD